MLLGAGGAGDQSVTAARIEPLGVAVVADEPDVGPDLVGVHRRPQHPQRLLQVAPASPRNRPPSPTAYQAPSGPVDVMVASSSPGPVRAASAVKARRAWNGLGYWSTVTTPVAASLLVLRAGVGARPDRQEQLAGGRVERGGEQEDGRGAHGVAGPSVAPRGLGLYPRNPDSVGGRAESCDTVNQFERRPADGCGSGPFG
jgi:hypothetical protein